MLRKIVILGSLGFFIFFFCVTQTSHFSKELLRENIEQFGEPLNFSLLNDIVSSPLHYIGNGLESIAFVSGDDKYVLKFFLKEQN